MGAQGTADEGATIFSLRVHAVRGAQARRTACGPGPAAAARPGLPATARALGRLRPPAGGRDRGGAPATTREEEERGTEERGTEERGTEQEHSLPFTTTRGEEPRRSERRTEERVTEQEHSLPHSYPSEAD